MKYIELISVLLLAGLSQGCVINMTPEAKLGGDAVPPRAAVNFSDPVLNQRRILLFGEITEAVAEQTIQQLFYLDAQKNDPIDMYLMTPGGDFSSTFAIENAMQLIHARINTYAFSECNSGGAVLLAAGTGERAAFRGAIVVIHGLDIQGKPSGEFKEFVDGGHAYNTAFWRRRARLPSQWLPIPSKAVHVLTAEQALEYGVVDKIIDRQAKIAEPDGAANESQPIRSETNSTSSAAGSRR